MEIWKPIPSFPGLLASSEGRIMIEPHKLGGRIYGGIPTLGQWDGKRFIYNRRGYRTKKVARLVCEAFHGSPPLEDSVCMHKDENARNNRPENLAWGTQRENLNSPQFLEYCRSRVGENNPRVKGLKKAA